MGSGWSMYLGMYGGASGGGFGTAPLVPSLPVALEVPLPSPLTWAITRRSIVHMHCTIHQPSPITSTLHCILPDNAPLPLTDLPHS